MYKKSKDYGQVRFEAVEINEEEENEILKFSFGESKNYQGDYIDTLNLHAFADKTNESQFFSKTNESKFMNTQESNRFFQTEKSFVVEDSFIGKNSKARDPGHTSFEVISLMIDPYKKNLLDLKRRVQVRITRLIWSFKFTYKTKL